MTQSEVVARARSCIGKDIKYRMGAGGFDPKAAMPGESCDCSGFVAWALGISRNLKIPYYGNGGWWETSAVYRDATLPFGYVERVMRHEMPKPGMLLVYPDVRGVQGHMGIVTAVDQDARVALVVHCSRGHYMRGIGAVAETDAGVFDRNPLTLLCRVAWVEYDK